MEIEKHDCQTLVCTTPATPSLTGVGSDDIQQSRPARARPLLPEFGDEAGFSQLPEMLTHGVVVALEKIGEFRNADRSFSLIDVAVDPVPGWITEGSCLVQELVCQHSPPTRWIDEISHLY